MTAVAAQKRRYGVHYHEGGIARPGVKLHYATTNRKLAPVELGEYAGDRYRPQAVGPFMASTYVSIDATCPPSCAFKKAGCYVRAGFTAPMAELLDVQARELAGDLVIAHEAAAMDAAFAGRWQEGGSVPQDGGRDGRSGRDLRLHVGGDVSSTRGARMLARAAARWAARGGGAVFTFTHRWRAIPWRAWGPISALASTESAADAQRAAELGYAPALVVRSFPSERAFRLPGLKLDVVPCPAETRGTTCVRCRLCMRADRLVERGVAIGFAIHGRDAQRVRLPVYAGAAA